jgi:hypothetical protein
VPAQKTCISVQNPFFSLRDGDFHLTPLGFWTQEQVIFVILKI